MDKLKRFILPVLIVLLLWSVFSLIFSKQGGMIRVLQLRHELDELTEEVEKLRERKDELEEEIELLEKKEPEIIEKEARRLGMIKKGEEVIELHYDSLPENNQD